MDKKDTGMWGNLKERNHLENQRVDGRIPLQWV